MEPEAQVRRGDGIDTIASDMRDMRINHVRDKVLTGDVILQVRKHLKGKDMMNLASVSKTYYKNLGAKHVRSNPNKKQAIREVYRDVALHNDYKIKHRQYQMLQEDGSGRQTEYHKKNLRGHLNIDNLIDDPRKKGSLKRAQRLLIEDSVIRKEIRSSQKGILNR